MKKRILNFSWRNQKGMGLLSTIFIAVIAIILTLIGLVSIFQDIQPEPKIPYPVIPVDELDPIIDTQPEPIIDEDVDEVPENKIVYEYDLPLEITKPLVTPELPEFIYVRIIASALNVRVGPSTEYSLIHRPGFGRLLLRKGAVCKVRSKAIKGEDGRYWYEIIPAGDRRFVRYPERVISRWFMAKGYTEKIELQETITVFNDTQFRDKRIEIDLSEQKLRAFEKDRLVLETLVSTGLPTLEHPGRVTPKGHFQITRKQVSTYMQGSEEIDGSNFDLPCIPFVMYFTWAGHAIHGAYWHNQFGTRRSHGCVNVPPDGTDEWLFWWSGIPGEIKLIIKE